MPRPVVVGAGTPAERSRRVYLVARASIRGASLHFHTMILYSTRKHVTDNTALYKLCKHSIYNYIKLMYFVVTQYITIPVVQYRVDKINNDIAKSHKNNTRCHRHVAACGVSC